MAHPALWLVPSRPAQGLQLLTAFPHAEVFWEVLPAVRRAANRAEIESRLATRLEDAEARWPDVSVDQRRFVTHWAAQLARADDVVAAIEQLHLSDLYLAFACAEGDLSALRSFATMLSSVAGAVRSVDGAPAFVDEILQRLRTRVLVPEDGRTARILDYAGRGSLEPGERNVLRMHFLEGLSLNQIAAMYQVNKSTISRRMAKAREMLLERTRTKLERALSLPPTELDSLLEQLGPRLDVSLTSVLNPST